MPASRTEISVVYLAGTVQGVALVTFPAAGTIFTSPAYYGLSSTQYGSLFLPQVVTAISASLLGGAVARRVGLKRVYVAGLLADLVSMILLIVSQFCTATQALAYGLLLVATAFLGVGFGLVVPALNTFTADFHPGAVDKAVLVLNTLLGVGTALAPVFVAIFVGLGAWWGLPILSAALLVGLVAVSLRLPLRTVTTPAPTTAHVGKANRPAIPGRFWLFAVFSVLYGICETMNGNWSEPYMSHLGATTTTASLALTAFWVMVTVGRLLFAQIERAFPTPRTYHLLPFVLAGSFVAIALLPHGSTAGGVVLFGVAGLGCSALLPLTISFSQEQLVSMSAVVAGAVIAFYQLGYGIAAFGAGPLQDAGVRLSTIFGFTAIVAVAMGLLSFVLARPQHRVHHVHPRPAGHLRTEAA
ncbi:MAG TPA: MFS transporter [Acidimicrobiales bacterium]